MESDHVESILRAVLALGRRLRAQRPDGGPPLSALGVLSTLNRQGPMPATRLAELERLQPQSLTRILAGLEQAGCISRERNEADRRETLVGVTMKGKQLLAEDMAARGRWLAAALDGVLSQEERATLAIAAQAMQKLAAYSDDSGPDGDGGHGPAR